MGINYCNATSNLHRILFFVNIPKGSKRCFFRFLTSSCDRGKPFQRDKECPKAPVFSGILVPSVATDPGHLSATEIAAIFAICDCDAHRGPPEIARYPRQETAMLHCDLRVRWKVASDLRFRAAISEPQTPSFCGISGDLAPSTRKSLAIAIVRFWCAKPATL